MDQNSLTLLAKNLEPYLHKYNIGKLTEFSFLKKGLNYSYLVVTTKGKYIFRIYRIQWRSFEDILYEVNILNHISKNVKNISVPIDTLSGEYIREIPLNNQTYYGVLFSYAEGEIPEINEDSSFKLGEILAQIHSSSDNVQCQYTRSYNINLHHLIDEPISFLNSSIEQYLPKESCEFIYKLANYLKCTLSKLELEFGFCHGDLHDWNVHCDNNSYTVFDFDCCGDGFRSYDLAVYWWNLKVNYPHKEELCWDAFRNGYLSKRTLNSNDIKAIPLFVIARRYWLAGVLLKNKDVFGTGWINEVGLNTFFSQLNDDVKTFNINI